MNQRLLAITFLLALFGGQLRLVAAMAASKVKPIPYRSRGADSRKLEIINGVLAKPGQFPFHAGLRIPSSTPGSFGLCGGALITNGTVMTAAHCLEDVPASGATQITMVMNTLNRDGSTPGAITVTSSGFLNHPGYNTNTLDNDIALIFLQTAVTTIAPVKLPCATSVFDGANAQVAGYGVTESGSTSSQLRTTNLTVLSNAACSQLQDSINNLKICAASVGTDVCFGDSGSSLTVNNVSIGIVSYGYNNCNNYPTLSSVFARVSSFRSWIDANKRYL